MKCLYFQTHAFLRRKWLIIAQLLVIFFLTSCSKDPILWELTSEQQGAGEYIKNNPEQFSEFNKLVELTGLSGLFNVRGPYTVFVPNNDAMREFYKEKNVNSLLDFSDHFRQNLIRNHMICKIVLANDISLGAIRDTNAIGDYISTEFRNVDIILNKTSKILKQNIFVANGVIHVIDKVLAPLTKDIFTVISEDPAYSIFSEGLRLTGIKDTLQIVTFPYGKRTGRTRYTLFAVPDSVFNHFGIYNVNDLIAWCGAQPDNLNSKNNSFYRYIEYHCLINALFLNSFPTSDNHYSLYSILSGDNHVSVIVNTDYKINLDSVSNTYTGFVIPACNVPAKNGVIHRINKLLPVYYPKPIQFFFEVTDYFDLKKGDYYQDHFMKWIDGQNTFAQIKFEGELQYYYKVYNGNVRGQGLYRNDCLSMSGNWWIEITTPKIMKGQYNIEAQIWTGAPDFPSFFVYVDGVNVGEFNAAQPGNIYLGDFDWTKTEEHKIKLVSVIAGRLFWDGLKFTPIQ